MICTAAKDERLAKMRGRRARMKLTTSGGVVLFGLATVAFIVLKLTHAISWSWLWVLSPALIWACLCFLATLVLTFALVVIEIAKRK